MPAADRLAVTDAPLLDVLAERWSPRAYDPAGEITDDQLTSLLEAARWAPSGSNAQPRRFLAYRRGEEGFDRVAARLNAGNATWAGAAAALIVAVAELETADGAPLVSAVYDLGQSIAHLSVQAHALGLHTHQMGGFDKAALAVDFDMPPRFAPVTVTAVGTLADDAAEVDPAFRERDAAPRHRKPLSELVNPAEWA